MAIKQGRIHGHPCRGRLGRSRNKLGRGKNELGRGSNDLGGGISLHEILISELFYLQTAKKKQKK